MQVWKRGARQARIRFLAPADDQGSEVLRVGDEMWNYLPNLKRALRISPKQEFHGGDFANADILRVNLAEDYTPKLRADAPAGCWLLELAAKTDQVAYARVLYWVRQRDSMPLRQEFYTASGKLVRRLELEEPRASGRLVRPSRFVMRNLVATSRQSELVWEVFEVKRGLDEALFLVGSLGR
jgi:outer membrane lipoprotein-sorting protein